MYFCFIFALGAIKLIVFSYDKFRSYLIPRNTKTYEFTRTEKYEFGQKIVKRWKS